MAIAINGANASVTYLNLPSGAYFISSVAQDRSVGHAPQADLPTKQPIVVSDRQIVSSSLCALSYIDHSNL